MEQFLAYKRAKLSGQKLLIQKALRAQDPVEAKSILNALRSDHPEEWKKEVPTLVLEGLQAKFRQNPALAEYLRNTTPLTLGEASTNPQWGIGLALDNEHVLDKSKWNKQGNLLGRSLMKIQDQMINERQTTSTSTTDRRTGTQNRQQEREPAPPTKPQVSSGDKAPTVNTTSNQPNNSPGVREKTAWDNGYKTQGLGPHLKLLLHQVTQQLTTSSLLICNPLQNDCVFKPLHIIRHSN